MYEALRSNGFVPLKGQTVDASFTPLKIFSAKGDSFEKNFKTQPMLDCTLYTGFTFNYDKQEYNGDIKHLHQLPFWLL